MKKFRILSLDGGGIKGTYTASVLATLEEMTQKRMVEHFDLITGTSTGGIIAIALGLGVPAAQLLRLYVDHGPSLFPTPQWGILGRIGSFLRHLRGPKCSHGALNTAIESVVGDKRLGDSQVRLVIPAFDANNGKIQLFKTAHDEKYKQDFKVPAKTVALSTAAAPTYYEAHTASDIGCYLDGGVWANCPAMIGILEAVHILEHPLKDVEILSIGTTSTPFHVNERRRKGGLVAWNKGLIDLFSQAQVEGTVGQAMLMTSKRMVRIDAQTKEDRFSLDDSRGIPELKALGYQSARQFEEDISRIFLNSPAERFVPLYRLDELAA